MSESPDLSRSRVTLTVATAVVLVILFAAIWSFPDAPAPRPGATTAPAVAAEARVLRYVLFLVIVLVGIFFVSAFAFLRWSQHFRRTLLRRPPRPTPSTDVWSMHRLPDEDAAEEHNGEEDSEQEKPDGSDEP